VPCFVPRSPTISRRAVYEASFAAAALPVAARLRPDVVVGCTPALSAAALAAVVAGVRRARLVQLVQDLVSSATEQSGMTGGGSVGGLVSAIERWALGRADAVSVASESFVAALTRLGVAPDRISVVPNWSRLTPVPVDREAERALRGWQDKTVIVHTGNMGLKQGLDELVPSIRELAVTRPDFRFVFIGDGSQRRALVASLADAPNAEVLAPVADRDYLPTLVAADVLLVNERSTVRDMSLPSKLTSYFVAGRPVVAVTHPDSATTREIARAQAGICVLPGNPAALAAAISDVCADERWGTAGQRYYETHLAPAPALATLASLIHPASGAAAETGTAGPGSAHQQS